ncbi:MAG: HEPN domain-containing protein [Candidatus Aminicenantes bacterium]|nr:MAG: HEPN domain-containing protein [Candidatus Aminicenantes bacterium]
MSLNDWLKNGWLIEHKTSPQEIEDLFRIVDRDLKDCEVAYLSADWRLNIAYNASLQCAKAALAVAGYRTSRESHHYRLIHSLAYTIQADDKLIIQFDMFRKKRNISDYLRAGEISDLEVREMIALAKKLRRRVKEWIKS